MFEVMINNNDEVDCLKNYYIYKYNIRVIWLFE